LCQYVFFAQSDLERILNADQYKTQEAVVAAWFAFFFPELPLPPSVEDPEWRISLGELLKKHLLFVNLLKILKGQIVSVNELAQQMQGPLPENARPHVLNARPTRSFILSHGTGALIAGLLVQPCPGRAADGRALRLLWLFELHGS
jgi:hypothetical protein